MPIFQQSVDAYLHEWLLAEQKRRKARSVQDVIRQVLHRLEGRMERIEQMQRIIFHGLEGYFKFERPLVEKVATESEMDLAVVSAIYEAGSGGILAKDIVGKLPWHALEKHRILRIVNRVNRNISEAFGRTIIEKQGKKWAFTDFGVEIWGETEEEMKNGKAGE